jgi:hypothetical protein
MLQIFDPSRESDCCDQLNDETVVFSITLGNVSQFLDDHGEQPLTPDERFDLTDWVWTELDCYDLIGELIYKLRECYCNCNVADSAMQSA